MEDWVVWFRAACINPTKQHNHQLINFMRLKLNSGWKTELKEKVNCNTDTLLEISKKMNGVLKKNFPDLKRRTNPFRMQPQQPTETHADVLKRV